MDKETLQEWEAGFGFLQEIIGKKETEIEMLDDLYLDPIEHADDCAFYNTLRDQLGVAREALSRASCTIRKYLKDSK